MKFKKPISILLVLFGMSLFSQGEDGMWMPHQMKGLNLRALGLEMDSENLYKKDGTGLMSAIVSLGGGTGEFVTSQGLILTNHHVAFGAIQRASSEENDYIQNGFIAWTKEEEIPASGYIADVLLGYDDVTETVVAQLIPGLSFLERYDVFDKIRKQLVAEAEKEGNDIRATLASMYSGNKYYLFKFKRIKDIRLVYAPPSDLGTFGGDIDNWMWPRHTCDFSFIRAYVSKENEGVDYHKDNIPYEPESILKISLEGFKEGDFSFVMGYPGRTYRNYTFSELNTDIDNMKSRIDLYSDIITFLEKSGETSRDIQIKYASKIKSLNNSLKNYQGKIEGIEKISLLEKKRRSEEEFLDWVNKNADDNKRYSTSLSDIESFMEKYSNHTRRTDLLNQVISSFLGSTLLSQGYSIFRTSEERQKPDMEREPSYQERDLPYIKQRIQLAERGYDLETDKSFFKFRLKKLLTVPQNQIPEALKDVFSKKSEADIETFVDALYAGTTLHDVEKRLELIELNPTQLKALNDPMIQLAAELEEEMKILREDSKALGQERQVLKKTYLEALLKKNEGQIAPDANSTIRFTYGFVKGYNPRDAVYYLPQTTLSGVIEKETGEFPFHVPEKLKDLYKSKDFGPYTDKDLKDIPACFLNTTSVTGGNSGSPTINAKGEQIGIIFDMTYESVISDYFIVPELQRTISVDIRFVLFITDKFSGATHILKELGF
ncbi:S46 family peptidase [Acidobacteriota bacterium]